MGTLFLVATPIGNLEDITLRALRVLREVSLIAAEDTRVAKVLLEAHGVPVPPAQGRGRGAHGDKGPRRRGHGVDGEVVAEAKKRPRITSYNEHNARGKRGVLLRALDEGDVALVSDAGMPGISDPGHDLVVAAIEAGHAVVPVPGASAVLAAVAASGLPSRRFHYLGFLPRQSGPRRRALVEAAVSGDTLVVFESPHRVRAMLADAREALGDRRVAVCRELTKKFEEIWRGTISDALAHFAAPRGEFTVVISGTPPPSPLPAGREGELSVEAVVAEMRGAGVTSKDAISRLVRECGVSRREAYRVWHAAL